jgi:hypothetical protein
MSILDYTLGIILVTCLMLLYATTGMLFAILTTRLDQWLERMLFNREKEE